MLAKIYSHTPLSFQVLGWFLCLKGWFSYTSSHLWSHPLIIITTNLCLVVMSFLVDLVLFFLGFSRMKVDDSCYLIFCLFFSLNAKVWFIFIYHLCGCLRALLRLWGWAVEFFLLQLVGRVLSDILGFMVPGVLHLVSEPRL